MSFTTTRELMDMDTLRDPEEGEENPCFGCEFDIGGDCGQGHEYGQGGPCHSENWEGGYDD